MGIKNEFTSFSVHFEYIAEEKTKNYLTTIVLPCAEFCLFEGLSERSQCNVLGRQVNFCERPLLENINWKLCLTDQARHDVKNYFLYRSAVKIERTSVRSPRIMRVIRISSVPANAARKLASLNGQLAISA